MSNRYVTEKEKAGLQRRMQAYLARLESTGIKRRQMLLTDAELARVKQIVACWRGASDSGLTERQVAAAETIKPD